MIRRYLIIALLALSAACTDRDFEDVNRSPNQITDARPLFLLNTTLKSTYQSSYSFDFKVAGSWAHQTVRLDIPPDRYESFGTELTNMWDDVYGRSRNLNDVLERTENAETYEDQAVRALALIGKVVGFSRLTDSYGDIPYFKAGVLEDGELIAYTPYDSQEEIYKDMIAKLKEAITLLEDKNTLDMTGADRLYEGNLGDWQRFANSLLLRLGMRMSYVDESLAASTVSEALARNLIDSDEQSAYWENTVDIGYWNNYFSDLESGTRAHVAALLVDYLKDNNDPRVATFANPVMEGEFAGEFRGLFNGVQSVSNDNAFSYVGSYTYQKWVPSPVLLYSEVCFLKAEAYLKGVGVAKNEDMANDWYRKGVESSLRYWSFEWIDEGAREGMETPYSEADITAFMASPIATLTGAEDEKYQQIMEQKWVSLVNNYSESYAEVRRTGYPVIEKRVSSKDGFDYYLGDTDGVMPRRVQYPVKQGTLNEENYLKAVQATDNNSLLYKVWWDAR
ncbi:hypothetical protein FUAX_24140 [Fulvitalea axinellae]|uniref:SusD/RagB family nutrient-binding outer membrane lipoprotein n=1 Tax=Fulvitalea axinellae TaxID=1182444 RepID=A0AAU9CX40_9BACT|nr:hypothetical protein FUAX_24140 [Fulvitalea axinellae]